MGDVLPVPRSAPHNVKITLEAGKRSEQEIGSAKLGAFEGGKVLKLGADPEP